MLHLLTNPGAQDSEQNIFGQLQFGVDYLHWIIMRAPSPVLSAWRPGTAISISAALGDLSLRQATLYRLGISRTCRYRESNSPHGYHITHREGTALDVAMAVDKDQVIVEPKITFLSEKDDRCVPDGKVLSLPRARSVYDLNEDYENELAKRRALSWASGNRAARLAEVRLFDRHPLSGRLAKAASGPMRNGGASRLPY